MQVVLIYLQPFRRNSVSKRALHPKIVKNSLKPAFWWVQGHSRSSMLTNLRSPPPVLVTICGKSEPICNRFHTIRANSGKITFLKGVPLFDALVREEPPHPGHEILSR